jgi:hypothetical protein
MSAAGGLTEVLYSVTVHVDPAVAEEWLTWMRTVHVPEVVRVGGFLGCAITREVAPAPGSNRVTFVLDYQVPSLETLNDYRTRHATDLQQAHADRYSGHFEASRSVRTVVAFLSPRLDGA